MKFVQSIFAGVLSAFVAVGAFASTANWPSKPVTFVVPYQPGGSTDQHARLIAQKFSTYFNQPAVVQNIPGGAGIPALREVDNSDPDHTFLVTESIAVYGPILENRDEYKLVTPIMVFGESPAVIFRNPKVDPKDFAAQLRGTVPTLITTPPLQNAASLWINSVGNWRVERVPYGGQQSVHAVIAGQVSYGITGLTSVWQQIEQQQIVPVLVTSEKRIHNLPQVPTYKEMGLAAPPYNNWHGVMSSVKTSPAVTQQMWKFLEHTVRTDPKYKEFQDRGLVVKLRTVAESQALIRADIQRARELAHTK